VSDQGCDVIFLSAQRENFELQHVDSIIEIPPECAFPDRCLEIPICRHQNPDVESCPASTADPVDDSILEETKQNCLSMKGKVGNFIEEQRSSIGFFESALPFFNAGRNTRFDSKELAHGKSICEGRTVDDHERLVVTARASMNPASEKLLPRSAFSGYQDREVTVGKVSGAGIDVDHDGIFSNDLRNAVNRVEGQLEGLLFPLVVRWIGSQIDDDSGLANGDFITPSEFGFGFYPFAVDESSVTTRQRLDADDAGGMNGIWKALCRACTASCRPLARCRIALRPGCGFLVIHRGGKSGVEPSPPNHSPIALTAIRWYRIIETMRVGTTENRIASGRRLAGLRSIPPLAGWPENMNGERKR